MFPTIDIVANVATPKISLKYQKNLSKENHSFVLHTAAKWMWKIIIMEKPFSVSIVGIDIERESAWNDAVVDSRDTREANFCSSLFLMLGDLMRRHLVTKYLVPLD